LKNVNRGAIGPIGQELAGVDDRLGFAFKRAGLFKRLPAWEVDSEVERAHRRIIAQQVADGSQVKGGELIGPPSLGLTGW